MNMASILGLSLRDMEYAIAVAEHGSFVRAAEQCHVAQPSLSAQVGKLEARLGAVIFERTTRRVLVTSEGEKLLAQMRKVLAESRALLAMATRPDLPFTGTLRLSAIETAGPYLFPRVVPALRAQYPGVMLILGEGRTANLVSALLAGDLDAVLLSLPSSEARLIEAPIFREPFLLACPEGHAACRQGSDGWLGLAPHERLLLEEGHCLREQALVACDDAGRANRYATSLETLKYMVAAGEGCTLVPLTAANSVAGVTYARLGKRPLYSRRIGLAWRRGDRRREEFEQFASRLCGIVAGAVTGIEPLERR
jgi:LysR family transcriptional regulator, hydrogen peroxide-inducible genes activator